jgi:hypothetical protein
MASSAAARKVPIPAIAIHGVGIHSPGAIERELKELIESEPGAGVSVSEFNWDQYSDHDAQHQGSDALWNLQQVSSSLHATAMAALSLRYPGPDTRLLRVQLGCCQGLRHLTAAGAASLMAVPASVIAGFLPTALLQIGPALPVERVRSFGGWFVPLYAAVLALLALTILLAGIGRAFAQGSTAPLRSSVSCVLLTGLNPLLAVLSTPVSINWGGIGMAAGVFCFFGVFASLATLAADTFFPNVASYSVWHGFGVARYLLAVLGGFGVLALVRHFLVQKWYSGPIKVLLDIARYVGDARYRRRTLVRLDQFVLERQEGSNDLVIVAHSLGSIIALDYLRNWRGADTERRVWLITLGSPYRRSFLTWLPGVLFETSTRQTAAAISGKFRAFYWLNVFRPWDYIGKSLKLEASGAGLDRSTGQYGRINGHAGYWSDGAALRTIRAALPLVPAAAEPAGPAGERWIPEVPTSSEGRQASGLALRLGWGLAGFSLLWMALSVHDRNGALEKMKADIDREGKRREVLVAHRRIDDVADQFAYADEFRFIGAGFEMPPFQVSPYLPTSTAQRQVDARRLVAWVRSDCVLAEAASWRRPKEKIVCTGRKPVTIAYLERRFYLPGFEGRFYWRDLAGWTFYPVVLMLFAMLFAFPFLMLASACYSVFLGRDPDAGDVELLG